MPLGPVAASLLLASGCLLDSGPITGLVTTGVYEVDFAGGGAGTDAAKSDDCGFVTDRNRRVKRRVPVELRGDSFSYRYGLGDLTCTFEDGGAFRCPPVSFARTSLRDQGLNAVVVQTIGKFGYRMSVDRQVGTYVFAYRCMGPDCSAADLAGTAFEGLGPSGCQVTGGFDSQLVSESFDTGLLCTGQDGDGDGVGCDEDCDDQNWQIYPGATERCGDGIDQDCDGEDLACDTGDGCTGEDYDEDGFDCFEDCDDQNWQIYPDAPEICDDDIDQDCDGVDDACDTAALDCDGQDADGDGYDCFDDCDDGDRTIYPGAAETRCDEVDQDCDGQDLCDTGSADTGGLGRRGPPAPPTGRQAEVVRDVSRAARARLKRVLQGR